MIKVSIDNLFFWSRIFPAFIISFDVMLLIFMSFIGFWPLYIVIVLFMIIHIWINKILKFFSLVDVFYDPNEDNFLFKNFDGKEIIIDKRKIIKSKRRMKMITIYTHLKKYYFLINSKENFELFR